MEFNLIKDSLSSEELTVEYLVRGLSASQVGIEKSFLEALQKEAENASLKPKLSHITENPNDELNAINEKSVEIDEMVDRAEGSCLLIEQKKLMIKVTHWRDRAQRLGNSYRNLTGLNILIRSFERLIRLIKRDIKRIEDAADTARKLVNKPSTSKAEYHKSNLAQESKHELEKTQSTDTDLETNVGQAF